jgi:hypothetical protein
MPTPQRLRRLLTRISKLKSHLLPSTFSLTGRYSAKQHDYTKAFLLLVHAELESYFEDRARSLAMTAKSHYDRRGACTTVLSRLLVYHHAEKGELGPVSPDTVRKAINYYLGNLDQNHGIERSTFEQYFSRLESIMLIWIRS